MNIGLPSVRARALAVLAVKGMAGWLVCVCVPACLRVCVCVYVCLFACARASRQANSSPGNSLRTQLNDHPNVVCGYDLSHLTGARMAGHAGHAFF